MSRYYVAFYRGKGTVADRVVRFATRSPFSHCELIRSEETPRRGQTYRCISASGRDNGVRIKDILLKDAKWDIYAVPWARDDTWDRAAAEIGKPYELWTMVVSQLLNFRRQSRDKWFCSELVAHALRLRMPHAKSPGDLLRAILDSGDQFEHGLAMGEEAAARAGADLDMGADEEDIRHA